MPNQTKAQSWPFQIKNLNPDITHQFKVYAVSNKLTHAEVFTKAFLALLAAERENTAAAPRQNAPDFSLADGGADAVRDAGRPTAE